ncbi:MAG TPA: peptidoglycan DD-metalloendopeptidase family protein [Solirubrobacterales bacterium]|nr:peptidoglycan DD-metalloendopeptidase family protein [Solirubrobacterales bacterium]
MGPGTPKRRGWRQLIGIAAGVATMSVAGGVASAGGGGVIAAQPVLEDFQCVEKCAGPKAATWTSRVAFTGSDLHVVSAVEFPSINGGRLDPVAVTGESSYVEVRVPAGAATGTVVLTGGGARLETGEELKIVPESQIPDSGDFKLSSAQATPRKTYFDGRRPPSVSYMFRGGAPTDVRVEVIDRETKAIVASFVDPAAAPNTENVASWDGTTAKGSPAPNGQYRFRIGNAAGGTAETTAGARFGFYQYRFPISARHTYGDAFGAGRNHQGQDVFAKCGTPLYAARGGRLQWNKVHGSAGNYVVIDLKGTGVDHMYAHLQKRSPLRPGARVRTGQMIGRVGDTGNASGCHLHFEIWSAPGWYEGGDAQPSVRRQLKLWDTWS